MQGDKQIIHFIPGQMDAEVMKVAQVSFGGGFVTKEAQLETYMDYTNLKSGDDFYVKARELALRCAGAYNCLVRNARTKGGSDPVDGSLTTVHVPSLMSSLRFVVVEQSTVVNISNLTHTIGAHSWMSFRFRFAYIIVEK